MIQVLYPADFQAYQIKANVAVSSPTATPATLPSTGGSSMPMALFGALAAMLIAGGLVMRRQMR